jgi:hypothetical protein
MYSSTIKGIKGICHSSPGLPLPKIATTANKVKTTTASRIARRKLDQYSHWLDGGGFVGCLPCMTAGRKFPAKTAPNAPPMECKQQQQQQQQEYRMMYSFFRRRRSGGCRWIGSSLC